MNAIAFRSTEGPFLKPPTNPNHCALWIWRTNLFPTNSSGLTLGVSTQQGHIVQKVEIIRNVKNCDDTPDKANSDRGTAWEYWNLSKSQPWMDLIAQPFLKNRKTEIQVTLSAGYLSQIEGATLTPAPQNQNGAHGNLSGQPNGFSWTLERRFNFEVICCGKGPLTFTWFLVARNSYGSYNESWEQEGSGITETESTRTKEVDGKEVE